MKTIWQALREGDGKTRLAVIADLVSIVGVSVASLVAAMFATDSQLIWRDVVGTGVLGLLSLAGALILTVGFLAIHNFIAWALSSEPLYKALFLAAWWLAVSACVLGASFAAYEVLSTVRFTK